MAVIMYPVCIPNCLLQLLKNILTTLDKALALEIDNDAVITTTSIDINIIDNLFREKLTSLLYETVFLIIYDMKK